MIESRFSTDRRCIFREVFTPDSIAKNGGVITGGVTLENGVATMDGTGYITYSGNKDLANKSQFSLRMKYRKAAVGKTMVIAFRTDTNHRVVVELSSTGRLYGVICNGSNDYSFKLDTFDDMEEHDIVLVFDGSRVASSDKGKIYEGGNLVTGMSYSGAFPTISTPTGTFWIGFNGSASNSEGSFELVEIYDGALSSEEVALLNRNALYSGFVQENCVMHCDFTKGTSLNWKDTDGSHLDTDIFYKHGLGASFEKSTSEINYGVTNVVGIQSFTLETVFAASLINPATVQCVVGKGWLAGLSKGYGIHLSSGWGLEKRIAAQIRNDAEGLIVTLGSGVDYEPGIPVHVALVRNVDDGVDGSLKIYVNALLKDSDVGLRGMTLEDPTKDFVLGNRNDGNFGFYGQVPYTRMQIGKANSALEVRQNYQAAIDSGYLNG